MNVTRCDVCGSCVEGTQPPNDWGYVFRPHGVVPTEQLAAAKAKQRKDLCSGCSYALERVLTELRSRIQKVQVDVSHSAREEAVKALLAHGEEKR